jgi:hypothetical protein
VAKAVRNPSSWKNRIVAVSDEDPEQLLANPENWRRHPGSQRDALRGSLGEIGWVQMVIVNDTTGHVVDGHARIEEAISRHEASVPVVHVELTLDEERTVLATLDPIGAMARMDGEQYRDLINAVQINDQALRDLIANTLSGGAAITAAERLAEWSGMPTFEQEDQTGIKIVMHFATPEDRAEFGKLLGLPLTDLTKDAWFPPVGATPGGSLRVTSGE